ncbi:hypothetical protein [Cupriavidus sp. YAF13]|uniref:hypothetical protein n=1 Tax=Cupriavidus sp. YAF13 TaxID=3233075 RepID=UPI003F8DA6BD
MQQRACVMKALATRPAALAPTMPSEIWSGENDLVYFFTPASPFDAAKIWSIYSRSQSLNE